MPTDIYSLTIEPSGELSLTLSDQGVSIAATHASTHGAGSSDPITIANTQVTGLGTMSIQNANNVAITTGTIAGVTISTSTLSSPTINTPVIAGGTINSTVIGGTTRAAGSFTAVVGTTGTFSGAISGTTGTFSGAISGTTGTFTGNTSVTGTLLVTGAVTLNTDLTVPNGGTGVSTLTGIVKGNGASAMSAVTSSIVGQVLRCTGTDAFAFGEVNLADTDAVTGVLPVANGGTGFSTNSYGQLSSQSPGSTVSYNSTFVKLDLATTFDSSNSSGFDDGGSGEDNKLRYTGSATRRFLIFASADISDATAGSNYSIMLFKNDIAIPQTECRANTAGKGSSFLAKLVTNWIVSLAQNDFVDLRVASITGDNGTPQRMRLVATPV
jgi:hypothetical protein